MKHCEFEIGMEFHCGDGVWRTTDIGSRVIVAIRIDSVEFHRRLPAMPKKMSACEAEAEGWFAGPPYMVDEAVFDEYDFEGCTKE